MVHPATEKIHARGGEPCETESEAIGHSKDAARCLLYWEREVVPIDKDSYLTERSLNAG